jgi:hypothetical protein
MKQCNMLGKDGLTITSANHLANIAKEMYEALLSKLEGLKLFSRDYMLAINSNTYRVENESAKAELEGLSETLKEIGSLKSLIAFLREAIKAKNFLAKEDSFEEHIDELVKAGHTEFEMPENKAEVTFGEEFEKLSTEQKARYFALEAKCAVIGSAIHPNGVFAKARREFFEHSKNPITVVGKGQEAELNSYTSSFSAEEVDGAFFALQKEHRALQAEFNKLKGEIEEKVAKANKAMAEEYRDSMKLWVETQKVEKLKYYENVSSLKVVIPQNLREIYEKVNAVANDK